MDTVAVTGGSGRIGTAVLDALTERGYRTANVDRRRPDRRRADVFVEADARDAGEVYSALSQVDADGIVHLAASTRVHERPDHAVFEGNAMPAYVVLEAASRLGVEAVALASSVNAVGSVFQEAPMEVDYLPVDEDHRLSPRDPYALGKETVETVSDGFGRLDGPPSRIATFRFPLTADGDVLRDLLVAADRGPDALDDGHPHLGRDALFAYLHVEDAADAVCRSLTADFDGHERFWAVAADTTAAADSATLAERYYPDADRRRPLEGHESLVDVGKAREYLGWEPAYSWREAVA